MDDLTTIEGIGPATAQKLNKLGITSFAQLAACDISTLAEVRGAEESWIIQATALATEDKQGWEWPDNQQLAQLRDTIAARKHLPNLTVMGAVRIVLNDALIQEGIDPLD